MQIADYLAERTGRSLGELFMGSNPLCDLSQDADETVRIVRWDDALGPRPTPEELATALAAPPSLDRLKAARGAEVNAKSAAILGAGFTHDFGAPAGLRTLDNRGTADQANWMLLRARAERLIASGAGDDPVPIRDAGNETFVVSAGTAANAMQAMEDWGFAVTARGWALKDAIRDAEDAGALAAIDIDAGWPS